MRRALIAGALGLATLGAVALISAPPVAPDECALHWAVVEVDAGMAYETVEQCGDLDGGLDAIPGRSLGHATSARGAKPNGLARGLASGCACAPVVQPDPPGLRCERLVRGIEGAADRWTEAIAPGAMRPGEWRGQCVPLPTCIEAGEMGGAGSAMPQECLP